MPSKQVPTESTCHDGGEHDLDWKRYWCKKCGSLFSWWIDGGITLAKIPTCHEFNVDEGAPKERASTVRAWVIAMSTGGYQ